MTPVIRTLCELVRIPSVNPAYPDGTPECAIAAYIEQFFRDRGIETCEQEVFPARPNVIARLPGRDPSRRVVFEAHVDTASTIGMTIPPFEPVLEGGRLYGRGTCDTKGGLAAMMHALAALHEEGRTPPCEIWLAAVADEEHAYRGVVRLCEGLSASAGLVAEPTSMRLVSATKGCVRFRIKTRGVAAHSSKPHLGRSAVVAMARLILELEADAANLTRRRHPLLGCPTCSIGTIRGGTQVNVVPEACSIEVDRRLVPGEDPDSVLDHYRALAASAAEDAELEAVLLTDAPLETPCDTAVVRTASEVLADMRLEPEPCGVPYGSDASKLSRAGVPSVVMGPGSIDQAHAAVEWVECEQVEQAAEFYLRFMRVYDGCCRNRGATPAPAAE